MAFIVSNPGQNIEVIEDALSLFFVEGPGINLVYDDPNNTLTISVNEGEVDHGGLAGLNDDDHTQYALLAGRSGGQTLNGGNAAGENLNLSSTAHATKGEIHSDSSLIMTDPATFISSPGIGTNSEHFGVSSSADGDNSVAIGAVASANFDRSILVGVAASSAGIDSVCIGYGTQANANATAIGSGAFATDDSIGIGMGAQAQSTASVVIGNGAVASDVSCVVIGNSASAGLSITGGKSVVIGAEAGSPATENVIIGYQASDGTYDQNVIIGVGISVSGGTAVGIGYGSTLGAGQTVAIGGSAIATGTHSSSLGYNAQCTDEDSVAVGANSSAILSSVAVGSGATADNGCVAIGGGADADDTNSLAIGPLAKASGGSLSIGPSAQCFGGYNILLGVNSFIGNASTCTGIGNFLNIDDDAQYIISIGDTHTVPAALINVAAIGHSPTYLTDDHFLVGGDTPYYRMCLGYGEYVSNQAPQSDFYITPSYVKDQEDTTGTNLVLDGGNGTGTGGSGNVIIRTAPADVSSNDPNTYANRLVVYNTGDVEVTGAFELKSSSNETLTADNQAITVGNRSHIVISSNNATATNRTFTLSNGLRDGQMLILEWSGTNAGEMVAATNRKLSATWTPTQYDTISLIWSDNASAWLELCRSANA